MPQRTGFDPSGTRSRQRSRVRLEAVAEDAGDDVGEWRNAASDADLARRVQCGDAAALEALVRRYVRAIHAVAASYLAAPEDVDDAAQEAFLRALRAIESYDPRPPFAPWLYQIARNVARNHVAAASRWRTEVVPRTLESDAPPPDTSLERAEIRARVNAAMASLPDQQRMAFHLADVEGYSSEEVARIMGLSAGTVRSHVHRARKSLRAALARSLGPAENTRG